MKQIQKRGALMLLVAALTAPLSAHPHLYVDLALGFETYQEGLYGVVQEWKLSANYSGRLIAAFDADRDGRFSEAERDRIFSEAFANLARYAYFNHLRIGDERFEPTRIERFDASIQDGRVLYRFFLPLDIAAAAGTVEFSVFDETNYVTFALRNVVDPQGGGDVEYLTRIRVDMDAFSASQPGGQRRIEIEMRSLYGAGTRQDGPYRCLASVDPDRPVRDVVNVDPFLTDPKFFGGHSPDNPFIGFN